MSEEERYLAYLLRLWRIDGNGQPLWRAALEDPHTGERRGFADLLQLFAYLEQRLGIQHDDADRGGNGTVLSEKTGA